MINKKVLKEILLIDLDTYEKLLLMNIPEYMRHYYQGKIDYISQLSAKLDLGVIENI